MSLGEIARGRGCGGGRGCKEGRERVVCKGGFLRRWGRRGVCGRLEVGEGKRAAAGGRGRWWGGKVRLVEFV